MIIYTIKAIISLVRVTATHLKLLPQSILDIYKVLDHIDILSMGIW